MTVIRKRDVWLWGFYDFANSMGFVILTLYFGPWFIGELKGSDLWMSITVALATILLLLTLPFLGHIADRTRRRMPFLIGFSLLAIAAILALGFVGGRMAPDIRIIAGLYFVFQFSYQASLGFYSAFLREMTRGAYSPEGVSGIGSWLGQLGNVTALVLALAVVSRDIPIFGVSGRPATFIMGGILFFLCALPVFFFLRDDRSSHPAHDRLTFGSTIRQTLIDLRKIRSYPGVLPYLIAYYLFADAVLTLTLFATSYLDIVAMLDDRWKNIALLGSVLTGMAGSACIPVAVRLAGSRKRALLWFLLFWAILLAGLALATTHLAFIVLVLLNGFAYAVLFGLSRAFYALLIPREKQTELFSVYILFERSASILGPLLWSGIALQFSSYGPDRYRFSMGLLALLVCGSMFMLRRVPEPQADHD